MPSHSSEYSHDGTILLFGAMLLALLWQYWHHLSTHQRQHLVWMVGLSLAIIVALGLVLVGLARRHKRVQLLRPQQWSKMSGQQFEDQVVIWLKASGFSPVIKTEYFDQGVDIVATKAAVRFGVQVKRSARPVGVSAVRAAVAGLRSYGCDQAMVVTNASFTSQARHLAHSNNCRLVEGSELKVKV